MAVVKSKKGKKWYEIVSKDFKNQILGETLTDIEKNLVGRKLDVDLLTLTNNPKKQNTRLVFKINNVVQDKANTEIQAYYLINSYVKKIMRKNINKVEDSFLVKTKDGKVRIKPILLTKSKVSKSIAKSIRKEMKDYLIKESSKLNFSDFLQNVLYDRMQKNLRQKLNKIYPLVVCEFRRVERVK